MLLTIATSTILSSARRQKGVKEFDAILVFLRS
jgi:hypothetical protein